VLRDTLDSSLHRKPGGQSPSVFTRLATELRSLPKEKSATRPVEFLPQRNYIHTKVPNQPHQPARHTCFLQANKNKIFSTPLMQSLSQTSTAQGADLPQQQGEVTHTL